MAINILLQYHYALSPHTLHRKQTVVHTCWANSILKAIAAWENGWGAHFDGD